MQDNFPTLHSISVLSLYIVKQSMQMQDSTKVTLAFVNMLGLPSGCFIQTLTLTKLYYCLSKSLSYTAV